MVLMEQINAMLLFFEKHPAMLHGWNKTTEGRNLSRKYWLECAGILNAVTPNCPTKTPTGWRMYYNELKSKTLKKVRANRHFPAGKPICFTSYQRRLYKLLVANPSSNINLFKLKAEEGDIDDSLDESSAGEQQMADQETNGQSYSLGGHSVSITFDENSEDDPLQSLKKESRWTGDNDNNTRDSDILEASLGSHTDVPSNSFDTPVKGVKLCSEDSRVEERSVERTEELHKLQVAEKIWGVKAMRERHASARIERELMQLRKDQAQLDHERAQLELERARLELERARRQDPAYT